jgi:hypothetical protein
VILTASAQPASTGPRRRSSRSPAPSSRRSTAPNSSSSCATERAPGDRDDRRLLRAPDDQAFLGQHPATVDPDTCTRPIREPRCASLRWDRSVPPQAPEQLDDRLPLPAQQAVQRVPAGRAVLQPPGLAAPGRHFQAVFFRDYEPKIEVAGDYRWQRIVVGQQAGALDFAHDDREARKSFGQGFVAAVQAARSARFERGTGGVRPEHRGA